jgi:hypothetical protein
MAYTALILNDILTWASLRVLVEPVVSTQLNSVVSGAGTFTITPLSMKYIYNGAQLLVGSGATLEVIVVKNASTTNFQADFSFAHGATDPLYGATFPTGQPNNILFTQQEMMGYVLDAVDDFVLKVRPLYLILLSQFTTGVLSYDKPDNAVRIERISRVDYGTLGTAVLVPGTTTITPPTMAGITNGKLLLVGLEGQSFEVITATNCTATTFDAVFANSHPASDPLYPNATVRLWNVSVTDLDNNNPNWLGERGKPTSWYEDQINVNQYGVGPTPSSNWISFIWYSQRALRQPVFGYGEGQYGIVPYGGVGDLTLLSPLLIPDPLAYIPYYGMLARVFRKDGELRDPLREQYCQRRYDAGVEIANRLLEGLPVNVSPGPIEQGVGG